MNLVVCLIAFTGSSRPQLRGNLKGLGISLGLGILYYVLVGFWEGIGRRGFLAIPVVVAAWLPHFIAVGLCVYNLRRSR
jgi:lipopolysaccharide export LptBFGC system permease protein LptF